MDYYGQNPILWVTDLHILIEMMNSWDTYNPSVSSIPEEPQYRQSV